MRRITTIIIKKLWQKGNKGINGKRMNKGTCLLICQCYLKVELYNKMKWPSESTDTYCVLSEVS